MRGFYRIPLAAWTTTNRDGVEHVAFGNVVECGRTTRSVYALSATDPRPDLVAAGAVFLGTKLSQLESAARAYFIRTRVRRTDDAGDVTELLVPPGDVQLDDEVLEENIPATLFAGDTPADVQ